MLNPEAPYERYPDNHPYILDPEGTVKNNLPDIMADNGLGANAEDLLCRNEIMRAMVYTAAMFDSPEDFARFARVAGDSLNRLADEVENTEDR